MSPMCHRSLPILRTDSKGPKSCSDWQAGLEVAEHALELGLLIGRRDEEEFVTRVEWVVG